MIISIVTAAGAAALTFNVLDCVEDKIAAKIAAKKAAKAAITQQEAEPVEESAPAPETVGAVQPPFQTSQDQGSVDELTPDPATDAQIGKQIANAIASVQDAIVGDSDEDSENDDDDVVVEAHSSSDFVVGDHVTVTNPVTVKGTRFGGNPEAKYTITAVDVDSGFVKISKGPKKRIFEVNPEEAGLKKV